jgi:SAM-dependent methyltransferase
MTQYQSFPGAVGDSRTLDKLKALRMPDLAGRSFLDVGCNEGFFCGFAKFQGAHRVVGLDASAPFIARARQRFPECEFYCQDWTHLPEGPFDTILLASALHYAHDQAGLLHRLVRLLAPGGVLVVELGIVSSQASEWVKVKRGIDERFFPTMPKLRDALAPFAWKWMGPSVSQDGDPVARHVLHISRRLPVAYLLMQPPAYGKSTVAKGLFSKAGIPVVSGDQLLGEVASGKLPAPDALAQAISRDYSPFRIDQTIQRIFDQGLGAELVALWAGRAGVGDFALDVYVPTEHQPTVERLLQTAGYLPILMHWQRPGAKFLPERALNEQAEAFYFSLAQRPEPVPGAMTTGMGVVDELSVADGRLTLRGWAITADQRLPSRLWVRLGGALQAIDDFEKQTRPDVQRHLQLDHALYGYRATIAVPGVERLSQLGPDFAVYGDEPGTPFRIAAPLAGQLAPRAG